MSDAPRSQLGLFGGEDPVLPGAAVESAGVRPARAAVAPWRLRLAAQEPLSISMDPPDIKGWREELGRPRPRIVGGVCTAVKEWRLLEDGTIGPCPWVGCRLHTLIDHGAPVAIGGGRRAELCLNSAGNDAITGYRPALGTVPTELVADDFALDALAQLDLLPDTCVLDVIARYDDAVTPDDLASEADAEGETRRRADGEEVRVAADALGLSTEQIRLDTLSAAAKLGINMANGWPEPGDGAMVESLLAELQGGRRVLADDALEARAARVLEFLGRGSEVGVDAAANVERVLAGAPAEPPPIRIRRVERDAPAPREPTADDLFTF